MRDLLLTIQGYAMAYVSTGDVKTSNTRKAKLFGLVVGVIIGLIVLAVAIWTNARDLVPPMIGIAIFLIPLASMISKGKLNVEKTILGIIILSAVVMFYIQYIK